MADASRGEITGFLSRVHRGLSALPTDIREDLVAELRSHLEERGEKGKLDLVGEFGLPEAYAARLMAEHDLSDAVTRRRSVSLVVALLGTARTTALALFVVLPLATVEIISLVLVGLGVAKPFYGEHIGLFQGAHDHSGALGWVSDLGSLHEVLGYAAIPIFIFGGLLLLWIGNRLLLRVARRELLRMRRDAR